MALQTHTGLITKGNRSERIDLHLAHRLGVIRIMRDLGVRAVECRHIIDDDLELGVRAESQGKRIIEQ